MDRVLRVFTNSALADEGSAGFANGYISSGIGTVWSGHYVAESPSEAAPPSGNPGGC